MKKAIIPIAVFVVISILIILLLSGFFNRSILEDDVTNGEDPSIEQYAIVERSNICKQVNADYVSMFEGGIGFAIKDDSYTYIDKQGRKLFDTKTYNDLTEIFKELSSDDTPNDLELGIINRKKLPSKNTFEQAYRPLDLINVPVFKNEYLIFPQEGQFFITNKAGILITNQGFKSAVESEGLVAVETDLGFNYLTLDGSFIGTKYYADASPFDNNIAIVKDGNGYYVINKSGEKISRGYKSISKFTEGFAIVTKEDSSTTIISENGTEVPGVSYDAIWEYQEGLWSGIKNGKYEYFTSDGTKLVLEIDNNTSVVNAYPFTNGIAIIQLSNPTDSQIDSKYTYINKEGKKLFDEYFYNAYEFTNDLALVEVTQGVYNYIDKTGKTISNNQYFYGYPFTSDGIALVQESSNKYYFIKKDGTLLNNEKYSNAYEFDNGFAQVVSQNDDWYMINTAGQAVSQAYSEIDNFYEGFALVTKKSGRYTYINKSGNEITTEDFIGAFSFYSGLGKVILDNGQVKFINSKGEFFCQ